MEKDLCRHARERKLDPMTREVIAVAVSAVLGCDY